MANTDINVLKIDIKNLIKTVFKLVKEENKKISTLLIQYNDGNIYVGSTGTELHDCEKYYSSSTGTNNNISEIMKKTETIELLESTHLALVEQLSITTGKKSTIKSYNVIYKSPKDQVLLCRNRIGNLSIKKSKIIPEF